MIWQQVLFSPTTRRQLTGSVHLVQRTCKPDAYIKLNIGLLWSRILAPGNGYTGGHSWTQTTGSGDDPSSDWLYKLVDPLNNTGKSLYSTSRRLEPATNKLQQSISMSIWMSITRAAIRNASSWHQPSWRP